MVITTLQLFLFWLFMKLWFKGQQDVSKIAIIIITKKYLSTSMALFLYKHLYYSAEN